MAIKNYMINDKWLDIAKQNIVEVQSTDGVIGSVKVYGQEYGGGGESGDLAFANVTVNITGDADMAALPAEGFIFLNPDFNMLTASDLYAGNNSVVLYQGSANALVYEENGDYVVTSLTGDGNVAIEQKQEPLTQQKYWDVTITGDCTLNADINWA